MNEFVIRHPALETIQSQSSKQAITMRAKRSLIWHCYDMLYKGEEKFGSCKSCKTVLKCSSGSTTSLLYHIKNKHQHLYQEFEQKKDLEHSLYRKDYDDKCKEEPMDEKDSFYSSNKKLSEPNQIELTGDDFSNDAMNVFKDLASDIHFTNVTLVSDCGKSLKAHKVVLSAFSPFFKNLLVNNQHQHPLLYIRGAQYEDLKAILDFIYLGHARVEMDRVNQFIELTTDLKVKGLVKTMETQIIEPKIEESKELEKDALTVNIDMPEITNVPENSVDPNSEIEETDPFVFNCHLCEYQSDEKKCLVGHMETVHTEGIYSCSQCGFFTETKDSLIEHNVASHRIMTSAHT